MKTAIALSTLLISRLAPRRYRPPPTKGWGLFPPPHGTTTARLASAVLFSLSLLSRRGVPRACWCSAGCPSLPSAHRPHVSPHGLARPGTACSHGLRQSPRRAAHLRPLLPLLPPTRRHPRTSSRSIRRGRLAHRSRRKARLWLGVEGPARQAWTVRQDRAKHGVGDGSARRRRLVQVRRPRQGQGAVLPVLRAQPSLPPSLIAPTDFLLPSRKSPSPPSSPPFLTRSISSLGAASARLSP